MVLLKIVCTHLVWHISIRQVLPLAHENQQAFMGVLQHLGMWYDIPADQPIPDNDDDAFGMSDGEDSFPCNEEFDNNSEDEDDVPDGIMLDLYQEMHDLRSNRNGLDRFSCAEKVHIELMHLLKELKGLYGVDDILVFAKKPKTIMDALGQQYELKPESVKEPDVCLGANMEKVQLPSGKAEWTMMSRTYVKNALKIVEALMPSARSNSLFFVFIFPKLEGK